MREGDEGRKDPTRSWGGVSGVSGASAPEAVLCPLWGLCDADAVKTHRGHRNERRSFGSPSCDFLCVSEKARGTWGNCFLKMMLQKLASWGQTCFHALFSEEGV